MCFVFLIVFLEVQMLLLCHCSWVHSVGFYKEESCALPVKAKAHSSRVAGFGGRGDFFNKKLATHFVLRFKYMY